MNTRKYPRTLEEAFGPHQRHGLVEPRPAYDEDNVVLAACILALIALLCFIAMGWLS